MGKIPGVGERKVVIVDRRDNVGEGRKVGEKDGVGVLILNVGEGRGVAVAFGVKVGVTLGLIVGVGV